MASVAILSRSAAEQTIFGTAELEHDWAEAFKLILRVQMQYPVPNGWRMALMFSQRIRRVEVWRAKVIDISADNKTHALKNAFFNAHLAKGENLKMAVTAYKVKKGEQPGNVTVLFRGGNVIPSLPTPSPVSIMRVGMVLLTSKVQSSSVSLFNVALAWKPYPISDQMY